MSEMTAKAAADAAPDGIYAAARASMLAELRGLWREAKAAALAGETARVQSEIVAARIAELAARIRIEDLTPFEALVILDPSHPDAPEEWLS